MVDFASQQKNIPAIVKPKKRYLNVDFSKEDWCGYKGHCRINQMLIDYGFTCLICKHRIPLDVPKILEDANDERNRDKRSA